MTDYLSGIGGPADLKKLSETELAALAEEIRAAIIKKVETKGGHLGSNLGFVEATIALHYVFDSPKDKFVFDVSHQSYTHKILTGRRRAFTDEREYGSVSGYTNPAESEHDFFQVGHTSTSVSLALGLAKARDLKGGKENIVAILGDGSLSGGEAFEGLDNAAELPGNFIVAFNDNEMSIAVNRGGVYRNLELLRRTEGKAENNFFRALGFDYLYVGDGNDLSALIAAFRRVKDSTRPVVVHLHTDKGRGSEWAEKNKEAGHWTRGKAASASASGKEESYESLTADYLLGKMSENRTVTVVTAATPGAVGLTEEFRRKAGERFVDVGICEEHAVAFVSGMAKNGAKPVFTVLSSFLQRTYDQLLQDLSLNASPATVLVYGGGLSAGDATHSGAFDMAMTGNIPGLLCLAPASREEYFAVLDWAIGQRKRPVVVRVPSRVISEGKTVPFDENEAGRYRITEKGSRVAILALGSFFPLGREVKKLLEERTGVSATLIDPRVYSSVDEETLEALRADHEIVVTLEDGVVDGGFGAKVARFYADTDVRTIVRGGRNEFTELVPLAEQYERYRLTPRAVAEDIEKLWK